MSLGEMEPGLSPGDFPEYGAPRVAGDSHDDDGQVIDSFFLETDNPPEKQADAPAVHHNTPPKRPTQLLTGFQVIDLNTLNTPLLLLTADPDRKDFIIHLAGTVAGDSIRIADNPNKLQYPAAGGNSGMSHRLTVAQAEWHPLGHTGAVWVMAPDITAAVTVSYTAVTS